MRIRRILQIATAISTTSVLVVSVVLFSQRAMDARHSLESRNLDEAVRKITLLLSLLQGPLGIQNERTASQWQVHYEDLTPTLQDLPALNAQAKSLKLRILQEHASIGALFKHLAATNQDAIAGDVREMIGGQLVVRTASMVSDVLAINDLTDGIIYRDRQRIMAVVAGSVVFLAGVVALLLLVLHRRVVGPIMTLEGATEELRAGRLDRSIQASGSDEVGHLAQSFEHLRVSLRDRLHDLAEANSQLLEAREEAENRAAEAEEGKNILDALLEYIPEGIMITGGPPDFRLKRCSRHGIEMSGRPVDDLLGHASGNHQIHWGLSLPDGSTPKQEDMPLYRASRLGEVIQHMELSMERADGSNIPLDVIAAPIRDKQGNIVGAINAWRDISEHKLAEEALRESEARYRGLINASSQVLYRMSPDWGEMRQLRGGGFLADTEEPNRNWLQEYIHPDDQEHVLESIATAVRTGSAFELTHRVRRVDGTLGWVFSRAVPIRNTSGEIVEWFGAASDITDRKQAEEALREREERYRSFFEGSMDAVLITSPDGQYLAANKAAQEMFGMTEEEIVHSHRDERVDPSDPRLAGWLRERAKGGRVRGELRLRRKDGDVFPGELSSTLYTDASGQPRTVLVIRDMTERLRMEEALRRSRDELEVRIEERTRELAAANKELEAFSYSVSHDLRAPLQTISGFSRFLFDDYADRLDEEGVHYLSRLRAATDHMSQLIDDILKLSKLSRTQLMPEMVNLGDLARDVVDGLRERNPSRNVRITIPPDIHVRGDMGLLRVMLENLLGNAWKYTKNVPDAAIELKACQQDGESVYCIQDNGAGFDMKFANKLFIPFSRLHTQAEFSGTGIGLALVQRILNRHGGRIWAESEPGKGATFCFTLPSQEEKYDR